MNIDLTAGMIESNDDKINILVVARVLVSELKTIGDDEVLGGLFVKFVQDMTHTEKCEGIAIDKGLVELVIKEFKDDDYFIIGIDEKTLTPAIAVLKDNGEMALLEKQE